MHGVYNTLAIGVAPLADTGVPVLAFGISAALTCLVALVIVRLTGSSLRIDTTTAVGALSSVDA